MTSRDTILKRLRAARVEVEHVPAITTPLPVAVVTDSAPQALLDLFVVQAEALLCTVTICADDAEAVRAIVDTVTPDTAVLSWDLAHVPLPGLEAALHEAGITPVYDANPAIRVGLTGADAAIAATGTVVVSAGPGRPRQTSLLPDIHIAVIRRAQIVPTMEQWQADLLAQGPDALTASSNMLLISGPSRTADIAMELVLGAHGPREVHVLIVP